MRKPAFRGNGVSPIIPECVDALSRMQLSDGVRPKQRVIEPAFGGIHIKIGRHNVVIAREHDPFVARDQAFGVIL